MKLKSTTTTKVIGFISGRIVEYLDSLKLSPRKRISSAIIFALLMSWNINANAQIAYVNSWNGLTHGSGGVAINTGTGTLAASGNLLIAAITAYDNVTISSPSGWSTAVQQWTNGPMNSVVFYKIAGAGDVGATFTFTTGGGGAWLSGGIIALSGENPSIPIDSAGTGANGGSGTVTAAGITTTGSSDSLIWFGTSEAYSALAVPSGYSTG